MVAPDKPAEKGYYKPGKDHKLIPKQRFTRKGRDDFRDYAHSRQYQDINLRMPKQPEDMLPYHRISTCKRVEKVCPI